MYNLTLTKEQYRETYASLNAAHTSLSRMAEDPKRSADSATKICQKRDLIETILSTMVSTCKPA